jgi:hypothetical protein
LRSVLKIAHRHRFLRAMEPTDATLQMQAFDQELDQAHLQDVAPVGAIYIKGALDAIDVCDGCFLPQNGVQPALDPV